MPYGVDKNLGGDSKENVKWMDDCVTALKKEGKSEGSAIAICKVTMRKHKEKMAKEHATITNANINFHIEDL